MKGFIYLLKEKQSDDIRYIGQTIRKLKKRLQSHIDETKRNIKLGRPLSHKENWVNSHIIQGTEKNIDIQLLEECEIEKIDEREIFWINHFKSEKLTNIDSGGKRTIVTDETKIKISNANKGEKNGMYGNHTKPTPQQKENRRLGMINSNKFQMSRKSEEYRKKISLIQKVDDWLLLDDDYKIVKVFDRVKDISQFLNCTIGNVYHSKKDNRKLCKKYWVMLKKDYERLSKIS